MREAMPSRAPAAFRARTRCLARLVCQELLASRTALLAALILSLLLSAAGFALGARYENEEAPGLIPDFTAAVSIVDEDQSLAGKLLVEYFESIRYITAVHKDTLPQALERLDSGQVAVVLRLPPDLFQELRTGSTREPLGLWLSPRMPVESSLIKIMIGQYTSVFNFLYGHVFGYQKTYVALGGDEDESWGRTTNHALNALAMYFGRDRYLKTGELLMTDIIFHVFAGILIIFSLLPAMGVLAGTIRLAGTSYEDRLLLACGPGPLLLYRLAGGLVWWAVLILPPLIALNLAGLLTAFIPMAAVLLAAYLTMALLMLALGRIRAHGVTLLQSGWLIFFVLLVLGGVLYPIGRFPDWLVKPAAFTPVYPVMQALYQSLYQGGTMGVRALFFAFLPLLPAGALAILFGRRRP